MDGRSKVFVLRDSLKLWYWTSWSGPIVMEMFGERDLWFSIKGRVFVTLGCDIFLYF